MSYYKEHKLEAVIRYQDGLITTKEKNLQWLFYTFLSQTKWVCKVISVAPFYYKDLTEKKGLIAKYIFKIACLLYFFLRNIANSGGEKQ